jgi:hypothetical protein
MPGDAGEHVASAAVAQLNNVHLRQLDRMLDAERRLRGLAESRAAEARGALYDIAEEFCSAELDAILRERKAEVQKWTPGELGAFILQHLRSRIARTEAQPDEKAAQRQMLRVTDEKDAQIHQLSVQLRATGDALRDANRRVQANAQTPAIAAAAAAGRDLPEPVRVVRSPGPWFDEWQQHRHFERSRDLIRLIGESGLCQRPVLQEQLNGMWNVRSRDAMRSAVSLSKQHDLIEVRTPQREKKGSPPQLLKLADRGRDAFLLLFDKEAAPSELDELMKRHKSLEHTVLNLDAAAMLRERLGAVVDMYPPTIVLDGGRQFVPDLVATLAEGDVIYVECERGTIVDAEARIRKWQNVYAATGGRIYIICPDYGTRSAITGELSKWFRTRPVQVRATDLSTLGTRRDGFWFYQRPRPRKKTD